ncbi:MAG: glycosyltransferase family 4 protein [candidate division WOR-3 bacterium]|nr:glycosyltransferase family 4 protein [candidate division WOR-3 bacterium]MCX7947484.1 glycosyltransferase family 4 protein [candidate division WOR-3 bacterium]MDW8150643.1 glycosyltransferase family 4 protein [candidate division WOR-3 bacterium]
MIAFITNIPTPQKNYLFKLLYEKRKDIVFIFSHLVSSKRSTWQKYIKDIDFPYEVIESKVIENKFSKDVGSIVIPKKLPNFQKFKKVIISGNLNLLEIKIARKLLKLGIPYIIWMESFNLKEGNIIFAPLRYIFRKFLISNASIVVCGNSMSLNHARRLGGKNIVLNYTTFNIYKFQYDKEHKGSFLNLVYVGRLIKMKRIFDILKAVENLDNYRLDIIGEGELYSKLRSYSEKRKLNVNFLNNVDYDQMPQIYKNYDALILSSESETFGYVVLEAIMSSVVPVVSAQVGAKDFIREDFHFKVGDIRALREKLQRLRDENLRNELVKYSKNLVFSKATPEIWVEKFSSIL